MPCIHFIRNKLCTGKRNRYLNRKFTRQLNCVNLGEAYPEKIKKKKRKEK